MNGTDSQNIRKKWEKELSIPIDEDVWEEVWECAKKISVCNRARAIQLKILHRLHISPNRRHTFNSSFSPLCLKCKTAIGTLTHCLWSCRLIQDYWCKILCEMQKILSLDLDLNPLSLLLEPAAEQNE